MPRFGYNGAEHEDDLTGGDYDFGARIYDPRLGRFLSIDPLTKNYPFFSGYLFARNCPIKLLDISGQYGGEKTRSLCSFIDAFNLWSVQALADRQTSSYYDMGNGTVTKDYESDAHTLLRVFNHDITSQTSNQIVKKVDGIKGKGADGFFSYYQNLGNDSHGLYVDLGGFPLDLKHFMANVELGNQVGETMGRSIGIDEENWQGINPKASDAARSSSFSPEDLLSNSLGLIFSRYDDKGNFTADLEGLLQEAATLFTTNELKNGKYIKEADVASLRSMIEKYHGTTDFRDFQKGGALYKPENMKANREKNTSKAGRLYKAYLEHVHDKIK